MNGPLPFFHPARLLATWFGSGYLPWAPGTWGSFAALPFAAFFQWLGGPYLLLGMSLTLYLVGIWAADRYALATGKKDPPAVVIDEVAGQWLALTPICLEPLGFALAFFFFRLFDILKTWPANRMEENLRGGLGIMTDDMVAGLYAAAASVLLLNVLGFNVCFPNIS